jgi:5-methylcytosine-specific restriction endonuclease McrA
MGYICPHCGEGLPEDEECPCQAIGDDDLGRGRAAKRGQDRRRKCLIRANGSVESFTHAEIGERDDWVCGICQDTNRLVDPQPGAARALSPSIDHIVPVSGGGPHTRTNVRITHLWCNVERNSGEPRSPEYMRAKLSRLVDGTPVPEELHRSQFPSWRWPASPHIEYMIALYIAAGQVAADPRYGDPAARAADAARLVGDDAWSRGLDWLAGVSQRRSPIEARWRSSR